MRQRRSIPVGKTAYNPVHVSAATASTVGGAIISAEAFSGSGGTNGTSISGTLSNDNWQITSSGPAAVGNINLGLTSTAASASNYGIAYSATSGGTYDLFTLGTFTATATSTVANLYSTPTSGQPIQQGFYRIAIPNTCTSGPTSATVNVNSVAFACTASGSTRTFTAVASPNQVGYTYQWMSSADPNGVSPAFSNVAAYTSAAGATSSGTTVSVTSTSGLSAGMMVSVSAGVGAFAATATVTAVVSATTFTVSPAPTTALSGGASVVSATATGPSYTTPAITAAGSLYYQVAIGCQYGGTPTLSAIPAPGYTAVANPTAVITSTPLSGNYCGATSSPVTLAGSGAATTTWSAITGLWTDVNANTNAYTALANVATVYARPSGTTTYTLTVTDVNNCSGTATQVVTLKTPPTITSTTATPSSVCSGSSSNLAVVVSAAGTYCPSTATNTTYGINSFSTTGGITNITNNSSGLGTNSYSNFTAQVVTQAVGSSINFSVSTISSTYGFGIWVDWNQDGTFAATEQMFVTPAYIGTATGTFTVPAGALNGTTRMRVIGEFVTASPSNPCSVSTSHETEDYSFTVTGGVTPPVISYTWSPSGFISGATNAATATTTNLTATQAYSVLVSDGTCSSTGSATVTVSTLSVAPTATALAPSSYCSPTNSGSNIINTVSIASTSLNATGLSAPASAYYNNNVASGSTTATLTAGTSYNLTVAISSAGQAGVWVDWNANGIFETTEYTSVYANAATGVISLPVPAGAVNGATRMRVRSRSTVVAMDNTQGCSAMGSGSTEDFTITITGGASQISCSNTTWNLAANVTGGTVPYTYTWSVASGASGLSANNIANPTVTGVPTNTYLLTVTDGCTPSGTANGSVTRTVNVSPTAVIIASNSGNYCGSAGSPVTLAGSAGGSTGPYSTTWSAVTGLWTDVNANTTAYTTNANVATVYARPSATTTYTLTATDGNNCMGTATQVVTLNTPPAITAVASSASVCVGSSANLSVTAASPSPLSSYTFASASGTYSDITGNIITNTTTAEGLDSYVSGAITLPTAFTFAGLPYTTAYVTSNGLLTLGGSAPSGTSYTAISTTTGSGIILCPLNADLSAVGTSDMQWAQVGNEIIFQWKNFHRYSESGEAFSFQARLNTSTGVVKYVYGGVGGGIPTFGSGTLYQPQVGISTSTTNFKNIKVSTGSESWASPISTGTVNSDLCRLTTTSVAQTFNNGQTYTFTPATAPSYTYAWTPSAGLTPNATSASVSTPPLSNGTYNYQVAVSDGTCSTTSPNITVISAALTLAPTATPVPKPSTASSYTFAPSSGTYSEITGTIITSTTTADGLDSYVSGAITLPTAFTFAGASYTTAYVTSNGLLTLGGSAPSGTTYTAISTTTGSGITLCPLNGDFSAVGTSDMQWAQVGNEIVFQWKNFHRYLESGEAFSFQARLNTSTGVVKYVYGGVGGGIPTFGSGTSFQPQVGIRTSATDFKNIKISTGSESWASPISTGTVNSDLCRLTTTPVAQTFTNGQTYTFTPQTIVYCSSDVFTLSSGVTGGSGPYTYTWSGPGLSATNVANPTVSGVNTNSYSVTVTDACTPTGSVTGSVTRTVSPSPIVTITPTNGGAYCGASSTPVTLAGSASGSTAPYTTAWTAITGLWTDVNGNTTPYTTNGPQTTVYARPSATATYTLTATDANNCTTAATQVVNVSTIPALTTTANPVTLCSGTSAALNVSVASGLSYCTPTHSGGVIINSVSINTLNATGLNASTSPYYNLNPNSGSTTTTLVAGSTYPITATSSATGVASVWIDYNQNGVFESTEWVQLFTTGTTGTVNLSVPSGALNGSTRMRVRTRSVTPNGAIDACTVFSSGSCEEFTITITGGLPATSYTYAWTPAIGLTPQCNICKCNNTCFN